MKTMILLGRFPNGAVVARRLGGWAPLKDVPADMRGMILTPADKIEQFATTERRMNPGVQLSAITVDDFLKSNLIAQ